VKYLKLVRYLTIDNIDDVLDIVLRPKDEDAWIRQLLTEQMFY